MKVILDITSRLTITIRFKRRVRGRSWNHPKSWLSNCSPQLKNISPTSIKRPKVSLRGLKKQAGVNFVKMRQSLVKLRHYKNRVREDCAQCLLVRPPPDSSDRQTKIFRFRWPKKALKTPVEFVPSRAWVRPCVISTAVMRSPPPWRPKGDR